MGIIDKLRKVFGFADYLKPEPVEVEAPVSLPLDGEIAYNPTLNSAWEDHLIFALDSKLKSEGWK